MVGEITKLRAENKLLKARNGGDGGGNEGDDDDDDDGANGGDNNAHVTERTECILCMHRERCMMTMPCRHMYMCEECCESDDLPEHHASHCMVCQLPVHGYMHVRW